MDSKLNMSQNLDDEAVENFKEYLQIPSVHPNCDYSGCVNFLHKMAARVGGGLPIVVHEVSIDKPVVVITWSGRKPALPSLLLSSHMDVVPVYRDQWTHEPFSAEEDENGDIHARGSQDMKCVGIQYLEAVHRLILQGFQPERSVHICFTSDEEIGSFGMRDFVESDGFKKLNIGCALDEGAPNLDEWYHLFYGERTRYPFAITCEGTPGHGSILHNNTAGEKLTYVINKVMEKREKEKKKLEENPKLFQGDITSINLTMLSGGVQTNVVPPEMKVVFDCRVSLDTDIKEFEKWIRSVCEEAGDKVHLDLLDTLEKIEPTKLDEENIWWVTLKSQFEQIGIKVVPNIFPATTDARYLRKVGVPAFGFSPMIYTPVKAHDHNEYLNKKVFLKGIDIYCNIIPALANVKE